MSTQRDSPMECFGSGMVNDKGSLSTVAASTKVTPCLRKLTEAFAAFQTKCKSTRQYNVTAYFRSPAVGIMRVFAPCHFQFSSAWVHRGSRLQYSFAEESGRSRF